VNTDILRGRGSLRTPDDKELVSDVVYHVSESLETEHTERKWWGGFTFHRLIAPGEYIIELEDGRKGTCFLRVNMQAGRGLITIYRYSFQGSGSLV
jgi:hypothetical protein